MTVLQLSCLPVLANQHCATFFFQMFFLATTSRLGQGCLLDRLHGKEEAQHVLRRFGQSVPVSRCYGGTLAAFRRKTRTLTPQEKRD
jgi:hypothetical protein